MPAISVSGSLAVVGSLFRSGDRTVRAARVALIVVASIATMVALLAAGIVDNAFAVQRVREARTPVLAQPASEVIAELVMRGPVWNDEQFPLLWVQPSTSDAPPPPGLRAWPEPGHVVVSPGLLARPEIIDAWGLELSAAGTGADGTIGDEGLLTRSELLGYAAPPAGRDLGPGGARLAIGGYGLPLGSDGGLLFETDPDYPAPLPAAIGSLLFLAVPSAVLLAAGIRTRVAARERRVESLWMLGLGRRQLRAMLVMESLGLVAPGVAFGSLLAARLLARLDALPLTGWVVAPGALAPSARSSVITVAGMLVFATAMALVHGSWRRKGLYFVAPSWPGASGRIVRALGPVVIVCSLAALLIAGRSRGAWVAVVLWATLLVLSLAWSTLTRTAIGAFARIPRRRSADASEDLVRRQLGRGAGALAALVGPLGLMVLLSGAILSIVASTTGLREDAGAGAIGGQIISVTWRDPRPGDLATFADELESGTSVVPIQEGVATVGGCGLAASFVDLPSSVCESAGSLPPVVSETWERVTGLTVRVLPGAVWSPEPPSAQVLIRAGSTSTAYRITFEHFTAPDVYFLYSGARIVPAVARWLRAGVAAACAIASLAALVRFTDLAMASGSGRSRLERAGVPSRAARNVRERVTRTALLVSTLTAGVYAVMFSWAGVGAEVTGVSLETVTVCFLAVSIPGLALLHVANRHGRG